MGHHLPRIAVICLPAVLAAQTSPDIGLTMDSPTALLGQICGPVPCQPFAAGTVAVGSTRVLTHSSAPWSPFALALGMPTALCVQVPGVANTLLLGQPIAVIAIGTTGPPVPAGLCGRGVANVPFAVPPNAPRGFAFHLQSVGVAWSGALAFGPTLAAATI